MDSNTRKVNEYVSENSPNFGPIAYDDLVGLTDHIRLVFKNAGYNV